jgi:hypothetical protein
MTEITLISFALNMGYLIVALFTVWGMLRIFDKLGGDDFDDNKNIIETNPLALGIYYGARFLGVCILGAAFVGG